MGVTANAFGTLLAVKRMTMRSASDPITFARAVALVLIAVPIGWIVWLGPPPLGKDLDASTQVVDREGWLLRAYKSVRALATAGDCRRRRFAVSRRAGGI
jgi:hypothetical protein